MKTSKYFKESEFNACTPSCSMQDCDQSLLILMDAVREMVRRPLRFSCAYRSREWELRKGRSGSGAHTEGLAVDFRVSSGAERWQIVNAAMRLGVKRIGVAGTFVHLDLSKKLPQNVIWTY